MKLLDRYILRKFFGIFGLSMVGFIVIFFIVDVIEKIDQFLKAQMNLPELAQFYLYQIPFFIDIALPMSLLLAAVFTVGLLSKNNELAAMKSSGISLYRISTTLLIVGLLFSIGAYFFEDSCVIPASRKRIEIEETRMKRRQEALKSVYTNITFQDSPNRNIVISKYLSRTNSGITVTIQVTRENTLVQRIDARKMTWSADSAGWVLSNFKIRLFDEAGNEKIVTIPGDSLFFFNLTPDDVVHTSLDPEAMRYKELLRFIRRLNTSGNDPRRWEVNLHFKLAFPLTNLIVILFGLPLAAMKPRQGIGFGAGMSLLVVFTYYGFVKFGQVLGYKAVLTPWVSVWLGNLVFLLIGGYLLYKIRQ
jgi:LPS export ABC transporter permease LptG